MNQPDFPFEIKAMTLADIPGAVAIEAAAYPNPSPPRKYKDELLHNRVAHYLALHRRPASPPETLLGVAGYWLIGTEAHVITIAIHPRWQSLGLGAWLLLALIKEAHRARVTVVTLEVRPSNKTARALYRNYGFQQVGRRPGYYSDTHEDALILTTPSLSSPAYRALLARRKIDLQRRLVRIDVDKIAQLD